MRIVVRAPANHAGDLLLSDGERAPPWKRFFLPAGQTSFFFFWNHMAAATEMSTAGRVSLPKKKIENLLL